MTASPSVRRRPADAADLPFLFAVYASSRAEELAPLPWSEAQKRAFLDSQARAQDAEYRRRFPDGAFDVVEVDGIPAGRLYVARLEVEIHIIDIALLPEFRGRGVGTQLLLEILEESGASALPVRLYVEAWNPAYRLYERLGFRRIGESSVYQLLERPPAGVAQLNTAS